MVTFPFEGESCCLQYVREVKKKYSHKRIAWLFFLIFIYLFLWNHRISWIVRNPSGSLSLIPGSTQNHQKIRLYVWEHCLNIPWTPTTWGHDQCPYHPVECSSTLWWRTFSRYTTWPLPMQLHAIPLSPAAVSREQSSALPLCSLWGAIGHHRSPLL